MQIFCLIYKIYKKKTESKAPRVLKRLLKHPRTCNDSVFFQLSKPINKMTKNKNKWKRLNIKLRIKNEKISNNNL